MEPRRRTRIGIGNNEADSFVLKWNMVNGWEINLEFGLSGLIGKL